MPTTAELQLRPELLMGPNPLIERAAPFIPLSDLPGRLERFPLQGRDWRSIKPEFREPLLDFASLHFVPTELVLEPASGLQRLFRRALHMRNPLNDVERVRTNRIAMCDSHAEMMSLPALDGGGANWSGVTATGKTTIARRTMEVICPEQVIEHEACPRAGWKKLVQCCYLHVDHPPNGARGALLKRILLALDMQLQTDYHVQYARVTNIDTLMTVVCKLVAIHRVALIIIDEKQGSNFLDSPWQLQFVLFYLGLMNLGVSVVLLGNPLAFEHLRVMSQVMRRFSIGGTIELTPAASSDVRWWAEDFAPQMREFSVVESCIVSAARQKELEFQASAGLPGLLEAFRTEVQRCCLRRGGSSAQLCEQDFAAALRSPRYTQVWEIAQNIHSGRNKFSDLRSGEEASDLFELACNPAAASVASKLLRRYKAETTRRANELEKKLKGFRNLSAADLALLGMTEEQRAQLIRAGHLDGAHARSSKRAR